MISLIITTINDNEVLSYYAKESKKRNINFIIIGDKKTPKINIENFFSLEKQYKLKTKLSKLLPENHYSRKNIGYILAKDSKIIIETDDDNIPYENFWDIPDIQIFCPEIKSSKWINIYKFFSKENIWPRGLSLNYIHNLEYQIKFAKNICPIQQRLADLNPDVDAIFRFLNKEDIKFDDGNFALCENTFSPFNSQNTLWFNEVFALLYLPSYCSFRMTDIYRSFIAQKILWTLNCKLLFSSPSVYQIRNEHNIMSDFKQELEGYLGVDKIIDILNNTRLEIGQKNILNNLYSCYNNLIKEGFFDKKELIILEAWLKEFL